MDDDSFDAEFDRLLVAAYGVARRILGDQHLAEDVASEALARAYAHWRRIGRQPWREGWVVRTASNLAIDVGRTQTRRRTVSTAEPEPPPGIGTSDDDAVVLRIALVEALSALPRRQREVVSLRYLAGYSEAETAAALRVSAGSIKTHLSRGLGSLRERLGTDAAGALEMEAADV